MKCQLCSGNGYRLFMIDNAEVLAYCPCEAGERWKYNGKEVQDHPSSFYTESALEYIRRGLKPLLN